MLTHLLSPVRIGRLELRNRIALAPMGVEIVDTDGHVREPVIRYYEERARGGVGLVIVEVSAIAYPRGANSRRQIAISDDVYLPGLRELARRVRSHGARVAIQLVHHGKVSRLDVAEGRELLLPSVPGFAGAMDLARDLTPEELGLMLGALGGAQPKLRAATHDDLRQVVEDFAAAALRARQAGFDAVEIHGAHGYLLSAFLSPAWNQRDDEYGGTPERRARLLQEVLRAVRERAGPELTVWCRLDAVEYRTPGGITVEQAQRSAELAVEAGAEALHVSAYADATSAPGFTEGPLVHREAGYAVLAAAIKQRVAVPVIAVGRISPEAGDRLIREGQADVIAMARKLLADPTLPRKLAEGRAADVRPCVYCYTCVAQPFLDLPVRCAVNPETAREHELAGWEARPAARPLRVLVAGGGPSGLEAARVAARRGHRVTLFEKEARLGGALRAAALLYEPNERLLGWLERQVRALDVELRLGHELTEAEVARLAPDAVIVAVGGRTARPALPGSELPHVLTGADLHALLAGGQGASGARLSPMARMAVRAAHALGVTGDPARLRRASRHWLPLGRRVVIVGGGLVGVELAGFLRERGRGVTLLEEGATFAPQMAHPRRWRELHELRETGVRLVPRARAVEITRAGVRFEAAGEDGALEVEEAPADTVILAASPGENTQLAQALGQAGVRAVVAGDAGGFGALEGAIHGGFYAALGL